VTTHPPRSDAPGDPEPVFAAPTPPGMLPAEGLADLQLPGTARTDDAAPGDGAAAPPGAGRPGRPADPTRTRRLALRWGAAAVVLAVVGGAVVLGVTAERDRAREPLPATVAGAREANAVQLVLGSCVRELPAGDVGRVTVVPCDAEHTAQVVGRTDASADAVWPGRDDLVRRVSALCGPELLGPGGRETKGVTFVVLTPSEDGWSQGDRTGLCLAVTDAAWTADLLA
jgi:hypothetical protein